MKALLIALLRGYKRWLSPMLPVSCRYSPTCSEYACEAIAVHGSLAGGWLAFKRLLRCHPWGGSGLDLVPPRKMTEECRKSSTAHTSCTL